MIPEGLWLSAFTGQFWKCLGEEREKWGEGLGGWIRLGWIRSGWIGLDWDGLDWMGFGW